MSLVDLKKALQAKPLPSLLLLYGEESYWVEAGAALVCETVVPAEYRDFNQSRYHGREVKAQDVIEQARTLPVFTENRLVVIKNIQDAPADQLEKLLDYLEDPVPETVLLLTGSKIDKRKKFFQTVTKTGKVFEFKKIYDNQLPSIVKEMARTKGYGFTGDALRLFCRRVGTSLAEVDGELDKLTTFVAEKDLIEASDVDAVVSDTRVESIFELMDAFGQGRQDRALELLNRLLDDGNAPLMVLAMLARHFRQLWRAKALVAQRTPQKDLPRLIGISPYFVKGLVSQSEQFDETAFREIFALFLSTDLALKSAGAQPRAHLEQLIMRVAALVGSVPGQGGAR